MSLALDHAPPIQTDFQTEADNAAKLLGCGFVEAFGPLKVTDVGRGLLDVSVEGHMELCINEILHSYKVELRGQGGTPTMAVRRLFELARRGAAKEFPFRTRVYTGDGKRVMYLGLAGTDSARFFAMKAPKV